MKKTDVLIIGAGVLGCFAARALSAYDLSVTVLEAREDVCTGVTRASSGIVYTGCDNRPGTRKAALCVRSNAEFEKLCKHLDVPFSRCGSLMVACGERAEGVLRRKMADGAENGVPGLRLLSGQEARRLEPGLTERVTAALLAPGTGVVEPWALGIAAFENAQANGVRFRFGERVRLLSRRDGGFLAETERETYAARAVLNCAGLRSDEVREMALPPRVRIFPNGGDYLVLDRVHSSYVNHVIFQEPEQKGKGLTVIPTVDGGLLLGPTERPLSDEPDATEASGLDWLRARCGELLPDLDLGSVIRSFGTTRPNPYYVNYTDGVWQREDRGISDLVVLAEDGLWSLIGVKTPGLTIAPALGEELAADVARTLGGIPKRPDYDPVRRDIPHPERMEEAERAAFIRADPDYGAIVCRCREVSLGQVREAIRRGAVSADGVKRRCGAGMGACQGSRCLQSVVEALARERGCPAGAVTLGGPGTEVLHGAV